MFGHEKPELHTRHELGLLVSEHLTNTTSELIVSAQNPISDSPTGGKIAPEDEGVGFPLAARTPLSVNVHYINTTDKPILLEILRTRVFPYLGVIGSHAKAKRLRQDVLDAGLPQESTKAFLCPVGLEIGSNHPHEIAVSVAAQMLQMRG